MTIKYLVAHSDLDGIVSAAIFQHMHPGTQLIGLYDFKRIEFFGDWTIAKTRNNPEVLYIDLDICRGGYCSYGHHIVSPDNSVVMPNNPNYICGVTELKNKYPMSTALMLTDLYKIQWSPEQMQHLWMIDGSVCNFLKYTDNVRNWLRRMPHVASYGDPHTPIVKMGMDDYVQSKFSLHNMQEVVSEVTKVLGAGVTVSPGTISEYKLESVRVSGVTDTQILLNLSNPRMFSHAIINRGKVSYTLLPEGMEG